MKKSIIQRIEALERKSPVLTNQLFVLRYDDPIPENSEDCLIIRLHPKENSLLPTPNILRK